MGPCNLIKKVTVQRSTAVVADAAVLSDQTAEVLMLSRLGGCNILRIKSKKRQITFCQGLQGLCSTPAVRPYTVPGRGNCKGGKNEGE